MPLFELTGPSQVPRLQGAYFASRLDFDPWCGERVASIASVPSVERLPDANVRTMQLRV